MIIFDYSQIGISSMTPFFDDIRKGEDVENIARHAILSKIKSVRNKFSNYGNVVIACDGRSYWRRDVFPHYKALRKVAREESDIPWPEIHRCMDIVKEELKEYSPYKVIHHPKAEADDVMGILVIHVANVRYVQVGLEMQEEPTMLVTWDGDMKQLLATPNVRMYSPMHDKFVKLETSAKEFLRRKIITGDSGDGVPNVFMPEDAIILKIRQKPCTEKRIAPLLEAANLVDGTDDEFVKSRIKMNEQLISFDKIPEWLVSEVIEEYDKPANGNKMKFYQYLCKKKCNRLIEDIDKF